MRANAFPWAPVVGTVVALFVVWQAGCGARHDNSARTAAFERQALLTGAEVAMGQTAAALAPGPQVSLESLQQLLDAGLAGLPNVGSLPALGALASATTANTRLDVTALEQSASSATVRGTVLNTSTEAITVAVRVFTLRDSNGVVYTVQGDAASELAPGQKAPLDLEVPVPEELGLTLIVSFPGETPIELILRKE